MNCLIWLLLLGCISGCGNNGGCAGNSGNGGGNGRREGRGGRMGGPEGRGEGCGGRGEESAQESGCGCDRGEGRGGEAPGMIPPPWQEYPPMPPRRGENNGCGCGD